jgi:hypothetical protein
MTCVSPWDPFSLATWPLHSQCPSPTRFNLKRQNLSCWGQMELGVLQQMLSELSPQSRKLIAPWHMAGAPEALIPLRAGRTSELWASGKFSVFQARDTSVLPKWILAFGKAPGHYKYDISEVRVCIRERKAWRVCAFVWWQIERWEQAQGQEVSVSGTQGRAQGRVSTEPWWLDSELPAALSLEKWEKETRGKGKKW